MENLKPPRWHWGKEIPIAVLGGLALNLGGLVWGAATLNNKVDNQEVTISTALKVQASIDNKQDEESRRAEDRILAQLEKVNSKLDRLIEKGK